MNDRKIVVWINESDHQYIRKYSRDRGIFLKMLYSALIRRSIEDLRSGKLTLEDFLK